ncbi:hypothetical protein KORDIASMS9_03361 [Kordia sp. SMS9]|uniref:hypothetical protein n=1 Tax=Kordia sp. SMS9 TaxID=2282170 RepID=UPI000E10B132|nr:hypothetical protein [Kordia sp. SMS9]AXG71106.1 hypothetical protein KORDIASMS9_03361 [Kordia sp. SMS9]
MKHLFSILTLLLLISITSCVQETHLKTITFKVRMNGVENPKNVGIKGNFTNPSWKQLIPMTDDNNDGIYEVTLSEKTAANGIQFKFVNQNDQYEMKNQPNRTLKFKYQPQTLTYIATFNIAESTVTAQ